MKAMLTFNNITPDSFAVDTQHGAGRKRPRHREALSCSQCRDRKVRCDRKQPCKQCQNRGCSNSCSYGSSKDPSTSYNNNTNSNSSTSSHTQNGNGNHHSHGQGLQQRRNQTEPSSPRSSESTDSDIRKRLDHLELLLASSNTKSQRSSNNSYDEARYRDIPSSTANSAGLQVRNALQCPQGPLLSAKTRFIGGSHWLAACNSMTVLKAMLNKSSEFDNSHKSFAEIKAWTRSLNSVSVSNPILCSDAASLFGLLPPQSTCETWIRAYCQTYRHIYDIVDELTLEASIEKVWNPSGISDDPTVICIVILLVCVGMQTDESERLHGRRLARSVEQFAFMSGLLHKPCIGSMKVLLLLTLLKTISCSDTESLDSLSGVMGLTTQVALAMGLHRNPSTFGNITNYHSEIRKRLWSIFFRLSFEHCMRTGVPMALQPEDTDVGHPANINLGELVSDADIKVEGSNLSYKTDATFSIVAARLAAIAAPYQRAICSAGSALSPESIQQLEEAFHDLITEAPAYMRPGAKTANSAEEIQQSFLTVAMHSVSLVLSLYFVINVPSDSVQKQYLLTVWDHSLSVLHSFQSLSSRSRHIPTLAYQLLWSDACRAAFSAGMALNRLRLQEFKSIMATRPQHTLIQFQETLVKYLTFMSRFWFQSAHLGPTASKNCLLLAVVVAVTVKLFSEDNDVSEKQLLEVGARSVEVTVDSMKVAMKRRHSFPLSPEPSVASAPQSVRTMGESGRSVSSPNMVDNWRTATNMMTIPHQHNTMMMDTAPSSLNSNFGQPFMTPTPSAGWTPQEITWPMDPFEYTANSASLSPISHVPSRQTTMATYVDSMISPPVNDWNPTSQWVEGVEMNYG